MVCGFLFEIFKPYFNFMTLMEQPKPIPNCSDSSLGQLPLCFSIKKLYFQIMTLSRFFNGIIMTGLFPHKSSTFGTNHTMRKTDFLAFIPATVLTFLCSLFILNFLGMSYIGLVVSILTCVKVCFLLTSENRKQKEITV